ncbi:thioredoxin family protein [bacterium]|nr:thioredoxin family protein [bacterium]MBU1884741.1 thioredoxin family protein [bacterium]
MRKLFVLMLFLGTLASAQSYKEFAVMRGYETDYKTAIAKAKMEKKDLLFVMVANYCPWCKKLEKRKLAKEQMNDLIHKKFIPLILNREEHNFPKQYESAVIPMIYTVNYEDEKIKEKSMGFTEISEFLKKL